MPYLKNRKIIIWGLLNTRHSHRYIHQGFYNSFRRLGLDVLWVSDAPKNISVINKDNLVIAAGMSSKYLPLRDDTYYVLHNFENKISSSLQRYINLQVIATGANGVKVDDSITLWDKHSRTLYQPWGLPENPEQWLMPSKNVGKTEYWIGAVWNNELDQGNSREIDIYRKALMERKIRFKRVGGTRSWTINGRTSTSAFRLINQSPLGAAVLGNWQKINGYVPCRAFKNIAAGGIPISNSDFRYVFGDSYTYASSIENLVEFAAGMDYKKRFELNRSAKEKLSLYSYDASLFRMLKVLGLE